MIGFSPASKIGGEDRIGDKRSLRRYLRPAARALRIEKRIGWPTFRHSYSSLLRSVGTDLKVMQELLRHSSFRSTLDVYTQAIRPAKHAAQAAVLSLVFSSTRSEASISDVAESRALTAISDKDTKGCRFVSFCALAGFMKMSVKSLFRMAGTTRLELATSAVTVSRTRQRTLWVGLWVGKKPSSQRTDGLSFSRQLP